MTSYQTNCPRVRRHGRLLLGFGSNSSSNEHRRYMSHMALARPPRQFRRHRPASNMFMRMKTAMTRLVLEVFWSGVISPTTDGTIYGRSPGCGRVPALDLRLVAGLDAVKLAIATRSPIMFPGMLALVTASAFAGAAFYINAPSSRRGLVSMTRAFWPNGSPATRAASPCRQVLPSYQAFSA